MTVAERDVWDQFFYNQQKRAPDVYERMGLIEKFKERLPVLIEELERAHGPLTEAQCADLFTDDALQRMVQNSTVRARGIGSDDVREVLASRGIIVAVTPFKKSFVLGDHPLSRMGPTGHLADARTELWLPIAPDVAVSPWGAPSSESLINPSGDQVRRVNTVIFEHSNMIAARSRALIESLAG